VVNRRRASLDEPSQLGAVYELRDGALTEVHGLGKLTDGRQLVSAGRSLDQQEEQIALRREAGLARHGLGAVEEGAERDAERRDLLRLFNGGRPEGFHGGKNIATVPLRDGKMV
jgi:hypothetical protein